MEGQKNIHQTNFNQKNISAAIWVLLPDGKKKNILKSSKHYYR